LTLLDWERWGLAPRGYSGGRLLAFSVLDRVVFNELNVIFAEDFEAEAGRVGMLAAAAEVMLQIDSGSYDERMRAPLNQHIGRILQTRN
jgi:hypothetical protein